MNRLTGFSPLSSISIALLICVAGDEPSAEQRPAPDEDVRCNALIDYGRFPSLIVIWGQRWQVHVRTGHLCHSQ